MPADARAVIFDLDDTLYPRRRFVLSGFAAVARHLDEYWGVPARDAFLCLVRATRTSPGRELQALIRRFALPDWLVPRLVTIIRAHRPSLRLPRATCRALAALRTHWAVGVVTNGPPDQQARKVDALGLASLVNAVVYADATGAPKPAVEPFLVAARQLGAAPDRVVVVGDDPRTDVAGARAAGMYAVRVLRPGHPAGESAGAAHGVVQSLEEVPSMAGALIDGRGRTHVG